MRRSTILSAAIAMLALAGCSSNGVGRNSQTGDGSASNSSTSSSSPAARTTSGVNDAAARNNCIDAGAAYTSIRTGLSGQADLEGALNDFNPPEIERATTDAGGDAQLALAELNYQTALARAQALGPAGVDQAALEAAYDAAKAACDAIGGGM
ncbi:hypothetical protein GCM10027451_29490 [Geodermatophilus aquaeductus]|uniref:hypothetical protein n=1 Tax=Geodermatophilus aquaeductus TaxID=1564161 RepID=UPI0011573F47|nr:hypothetical protein [Geodermatophilus aquaeductus]